MEVERAGAFADARAQDLGRDAARREVQRSKLGLEHRDALLVVPPGGFSDGIATSRRVRSAIASAYGATASDACIHEL